ncbi:MAG: hypothetical protein M1832_005645 [Thelocarpon impressellum]|nr:MAG: hypothetical protein M1832_005645 [Thelocarpon impressellum]
MPAAQPRRFALLLAGVAVFLLCTLALSSRRGAPDTPRASYADEPVQAVHVSAETLRGEAIMPKLGNETLKAELGRAAWKVLHTTMARFPDRPTADQSGALQSYIHLFARLYPCGECAGHFRHIITRFPPQVTSRSSAAAWACHVHNEVNRSLRKDLFDCSKIGDFYDCGCAGDDEEGEVGKTKGEGKQEDAAGELDKARRPLELQKEG